MDLTYLTASVEKNGDKVKESFKRVFDNIRVIEIEPTENLHRQVPAVEKQMRDMGSVRFDPDDFFVCDYDLRELGKVLCISPHYEEEATLFPAYLHKEQGDEVRLIVVTPIPQKAGRPDLEQTTHDVYQKDLGLDSDEYEFLNLPDGKVAEHEKEFVDALKRNFKEFDPDTIITTPVGSNFDHKFIARTIFEFMKEFAYVDYEISPRARFLTKEDETYQPHLDPAPGRRCPRYFNLLYGNVLQNMQFRPSLYPVVDGDIRDKLAGTFAANRIGSGPDHRPTIDRLFETGFPEPLNRYVGTLVESGKISEEASRRIGVYALQVVQMDKPYKVPHKTSIFEK